MGDIGDYWNEHRAWRKSQGLPARPARKKPPAYPPRKSEMRAFAAAGFEQKSEWHWQRRVNDQFLDYWPSTSKWRHQGINHIGSWKDLLAFIAKMEADNGR